MTAVASFLFADLCGFTAYTCLHGDELAADLAIDFQERVRELAVEEGCSVVKSIGDAVMVHSRDCRAAARLACRILALSEADGFPPIPGAGIIAEYLDETHGLEAGERRLLPASMAERVEVRRLMAWFNEKFFEEVSNPLVTERIYKRFMSEENGGGAPATDVIRAAKVNVRYHLAYIGWLAQTRNFLAGDRLTYADLAAAAHLSAIDYLGDVPWSEDDAAKAWYARVKSRPSFRPLLSEWLAGVPASRTYVDLDF